jgi:manganese/iron transport system substrate-binding protein
MSRKKVFWLISWLAIVAWLISACAPAQVPQSIPLEQHEAEYQAETTDLAPVSLNAGEKVKVVATTNIVAHIVSVVGGDAIELTELLPIGADPHAYIATPQDVAAVTVAHVIFANGADLEIGFLPDLAQDTAAPVIYVSNGIEFRKLGEGDTPEHEGEQDHHSQGIDPHTWTTPTNVAIFVHNIEHALSSLDPANADTYRANAQAYQTSLQTLDEWIKTQIATIPPENRKLITDHASFGYYADRYGLEQIGAVIPAFSTAAEPSARQLAALEDATRTYGVKAVFVGTTVNPGLARQVAEDTGTQLVTLYTGSLGPPGSGVETYVDYTCYNTITIIEALGGAATITGSLCQ